MSSESYSSPRLTVLGPVDELTEGGGSQTGDAQGSSPTKTTPGDG
jgi:hypothetical protein